MILRAGNPDAVCAGRFDDLRHELDALEAVEGVREIEGERVGGFSGPAGGDCLGGVGVEVREAGWESFGMARDDPGGTLREREGSRAVRCAGLSRLPVWFEFEPLRNSWNHSSEPFEPDILNLRLFSTPAAAWVTQKQPRAPLDILRRAPA